MGADKLNNNSDKYVQLKTSYVSLWLYFSNAQNTSIMWHTSWKTWKTQKLQFLLADWLLKMVISPSAAQYTWQPMKYKKSFSNRNGDTRFWKNSDDILFCLKKIIITPNRTLSFDWWIVYHVLYVILFYRTGRTLHYWQSH